MSENLSVIDLGAGINGLSYNYFRKRVGKINYLGIEAVGQLVDLINVYFKNKGLENAETIYISLFEKDKIKKIIKGIKGEKIIFLFKTIDSLEMIERDYSKKLLKQIVSLVDKIVVSFATRSLISKKEFKVKRYWFENFIKENFEVLDDFVLGGERYFVFRKKLIISLR